LEVQGIQVNYCKSPVCKNYGIPASTEKQKRGSKIKDKYKIIASGRNTPALHCLECNEHPPIKSNQGVVSELERMLSAITPKEPTCPHSDCSNHTKGISLGKEHYSSFGKTSSGSPRFKCKSCNKIFTVKKSTSGQRTPHKNRLIFSLLMNKTPFNRICEVADINPKTLYDKINFLHRQCLSFVADREKKLLKGMKINRLYVSVDRQEYIVNWTKRADKRNIALSAVGSADNVSSYVFGMCLNYIPSLDANAVERDAVKVGDYDSSFPFRKYAQLWLQGDYDASVKRSTKLKSVDSLNDDIAEMYDEAISRVDIESSEKLSSVNMLPNKGVQVHAEYTLYGHFYFLSKLFSGAEKVRFFLDQDSGMRAACLAGFQARITARSCDAFYVRINKDFTVDEKRCALETSRKSFKKEQVSNPDLTENEVKLKVIKERMDNMKEIGRWKDKWLLHPFPNMSEPEKAVCYLTDCGDYDEDHKAWLYNKASTQGIDRFFMQIRRRISLLERPISSSSTGGRKWYGYSAYNPESIVKMLDIFRVFYNYCLVGKDKKTPAMRIGLAKGKIDLEDIVYFGNW